MDLADSSEDDEFAALNRAGSRAAGKAKRGELGRLLVHCPGLAGLSNPRATKQGLRPSQVKFGVVHCPELTCGQVLRI